MMYLVIDANVLVAELLRQRGRELIFDPNLSLYAPERILNEAEYELRRRIGHLVFKERFTKESGGILQETLLQAIATYIVPYPIESYGYLFGRSERASS